MNEDAKKSVDLVIGVAAVFAIPFAIGVIGSVYAYRAGYRDGRKQTWNETTLVSRTILTAFGIKSESDKKE